MSKTIIIIEDHILFKGFPIKGGITDNIEEAKEAIKIGSVYALVNQRGMEGILQTSWLQDIRRMSNCLCLETQYTVYVAYYNQ